MSSNPTSSLANDTAIEHEKPYVRWKEWDWILPEAVGVLLIIMTTWILISLICFGIKTKKWTKTKQKNHEKLSAGRVLVAAVFCAITTLLRLGNSQVLISIGRSDQECEIISDLSLIFYCLAAFFVYMFLWTRQSIFYINGMLNTKFSKYLRFFSWLSIVLIFLGGLSVVLIGSVPKNYFWSREGCIYKDHHENAGAPLVIGAVLVMLSGQGVLVALFVYPLQKHRRKENNSSCCYTAACCLKKKPVTENSIRDTVSALDRSRPTKRTRSVRKINLIMKRSVVFSTIAIVTDLGFLVLSNYAFTGEVNRRIPTMLYDISAFMNLVFVISSFLCWRMIVILPVKKSRARTAAQTGSSTNT